MICPKCGLEVGSYAKNQNGEGCWKCFPKPDLRTKEQLLKKLKIAQRELQVMKAANRDAWKKIEELTRK